ncbi:MAG: AMP-binding protein [Myxococcota bacterium]
MTAVLGRHSPGDAVALGPQGVRTASDLLALAAVVQRRVRDVPGTPIVACQDRYFLAASLLGAWLAGRPGVLPLSARDASAEPPPSEGGPVLHDADGRGDFDLRVLEGEAARGTVVPPAPDPAAETPLVVVRTSGTTGQPEAHPKTARQLLGEGEVLASHFGLVGCRVVSTVPATHLYGLLFGVVVPLVAGGRFHRATPRYPQDTLALLEQGSETGPTVLVTVPPQLDALARHEPARWPEVRRIFSSGGPLRPDTAATLAHRWHPVTEVLGSTETGGIASRGAPDEGWQPLPGVQVSEGDDQGRLMLRSPFIAASEPSPVACPDLIRLQPDGRFVHLGRLDDVIKVGGKRVSLGGMRAHLRSWPDVDDAAVWSRSVAGARHVEVLAAVAATALTPEGVRARLLQAFDPVVVPRRVVVVPELPRDAVGKVSRERLEALLPDRWTVERTETGAETDRSTLHPGLGYFEGHYPQWPVLPGVVQLTKLVIPAVRDRWPELSVPVGLRRVKFLLPLQPGAVVDVTVKREGDDVRFELSTGGRSAAVGTVLFAPGEAP